MIRPTATAAIAAKNTAPAATSLMKPILSWKLGWIKSAIFSTAVFSPSMLKTNPIAIV